MALTKTTALGRVSALGRKLLMCRRLGATNAALRSGCSAFRIPGVTRDLLHAGLDGAPGFSDSLAR